MDKAEPVTFREKLAMFLMRQAYIWIEKIDRKAVPKASPFTLTFKYKVGDGCTTWGKGWTIWGDGWSGPGASLFYINDYDYDKAHTEAVNG